MMTVVVAARQPQSQRRYRAVLEQTGVATYIVTDLEQLIKFVRTRPVDIVLFDVGDPRWSARKWLDTVSLDSDLAAVPIVWIGSEATAVDLQAITEYRPGTHLAKFPDAATLKQAMDSLARSVRQSGGAGSSGSTIQESSDWKPAVKTIDDALSIFADSAKNPATDKSAKSAADHKGARPADLPVRPAGVSGEDYDWFVAEMVKPDAGSGQPQGDSGYIETDTPTGTEKGILVTSPHNLPPGLSTPPEAASDGGAQLPMLDGLLPTNDLSSPPDNHPVSESADSALVDRIAGEVAARLAVEILKNLDHEAIRRAVEATLARPR